MSFYLLSFSAYLVQTKDQQLNHYCVWTISVWTTWQKDRQSGGIQKNFWRKSFFFSFFIIQLHGVTFSLDNISWQTILHSTYNTNYGIGAWSILCWTIPVGRTWLRDRKVEKQIHTAVNASVSVTCGIREWHTIINLKNN